MNESASASFKPGLGFVLTAVAVVVVVLLALSAAVASALGASGVSSVLGGLALLIVGCGLLAALRVPARSLVINAPRLRLARLRSRQADQPVSTPSAGQSESGAQSASTLCTPAASSAGNALSIPAPGTGRELTVLDVTSGPVSTVLATSKAGRWTDEQLAGTTAGETVARVVQLLAGAVGFLLVALGLAGILGQVL